MKGDTYKIITKHFILTGNKQNFVFWQNFKNSLLEIFASILNEFSSGLGELRRSWILLPSKIAATLHKWRFSEKRQIFYVLATFTKISFTENLGKISCRALCQKRKGNKSRKNFVKNRLFGVVTVMAKLSSAENQNREKLRLENEVKS